jgi:hypothetical protein
MRKFLSTAVAAALLIAAGVATSANATTFVGGYAESHNTGDGLQLLTNFTFNLNTAGDVAHVDLFQLYTNETSLDFDDLFGKAISVTLSFTQPEIFGGSIGGTTDGTFTFNLNGIFTTKNNLGTVAWDNNGNTVLDFGNGGQLGVHLDDANFNLTKTGLFSGKLTPGPAGAATITADFSLISPSLGVPEPASWALMIGGFGMAGGMLRRRAVATAA